MQTPCKLWYLLGVADVGPCFAYQDEPNMVLAWTDGDWSGNAVTCKSTSAGAVQLGSHPIETWSVRKSTGGVARLKVISMRSVQVVLEGSVKHGLLEIIYKTSPLRVA